MNVKEIDNALMNPDFAIELLQLFARYGLVNGLALRNSLIRKEYNEAKQRDEHIGDFIERTAAKYFISPKNIEYVLYGKKIKSLKGFNDNGIENKT